MKVVVYAFVCKYKKVWLYNILSSAEVSEKLVFKVAITNMIEMLSKYPKVNMNV